jgi:hypothetical protein
MLTIIIAAGLSVGQVYQMSSPHEDPGVIYRMETPPEVKAPAALPDPRIEIDAGPEAPPPAPLRPRARVEKTSYDRDLYARGAAFARAKSNEEKFPRMMAALARERRARSAGVEPIIDDHYQPPPAYVPRVYTPPQPAVLTPPVQWVYPVYGASYGASGIVCGPSGCGPAASYGMAPRRGPFARLFGM